MTFLHKNINYVKTTMMRDYNFFRDFDKFFTPVAKKVVAMTWRVFGINNFNLARILTFAAIGGHVTMSLVKDVEDKAWFSVIVLPIVFLALLRFVLMGIKRLESSKDEDWPVRTEKLVTLRIRIFKSFTFCAILFVLTGGKSAYIAHAAYLLALGLTALHVIQHNRLPRPTPLIYPVIEWFSDNLAEQQP